MHDFKDQVTGYNRKDSDSFAGLPSRKITPTRVALHLGFWTWDLLMAVYAFNRILKGPDGQPPDPGLYSLMLGFHLGTTVVLFYLYGYLVVPSLLNIFINYEDRRSQSGWQFVLHHKWTLLAITGVTLAVIVFFNVYDYYLFTYARDHFSPVPDYIKRNSDLFGRTGPFGIFTQDTITVQTFLWAYNISYLVLPVLLRIIRFAISWGVESKKQKEKNEFLIQNQLQTLQYQINPHFLFNIFNNIYALIQRTNNQAAELLRKLTELMKYTLYKTGDNFVPLTGELDFLRNYIDIERSRQFIPENIEYIQSGKTDGFMVPPLLLITFIENAFKHGLNNSYEDGWVRIRIAIDAVGKTLNIDVSNNVSDSASPDQDYPAPKKIGGVGLVNAQKRLDLLFKPTDYSIKVTGDSATYQVLLTIPLKQNPVYESQNSDQVPNY